MGPFKNVWLWTFILLIPKFGFLLEIYLHFYTNQCYKLASPFLLNQKPIYCTYCETYASGIYKVYSFFSDGPIFPIFFRLKMGKLRGTVAAQGGHISFKICYTLDSYIENEFKIWLLKKLLTMLVSSQLCVSYPLAAVLLYRTLIAI